MKHKRFLAFLLCILLLTGAVIFSSFAYEEDLYDEPEEIPISVTTSGKTYSLFTEENLEEQDGTTFIYVIKSGGRYYTPAHPGISDTTKAYDSIAAVDITSYYDAETNTFSNIPNSANVGAMQYQMYPFTDSPEEYAGSSALFLDGNIMFKLSAPFGDNGETWFDSGICYYDRDDTYSYSRALWNANGDGSGYLYDSYRDWIGDSNYWVIGALDLYIDGIGNKRFSLRNVSESYNNGDEVEVKAYLYSAPCGHASLSHSSYVAPTCMDKGCNEYWYCCYCTTYFTDEECTTSYNGRPVLPALGHDYGDTKCENCNNPIPKYTKITSYEQFRTIKPGASFIAVAEIDDGNGGKEYYVLKEPVNITNSDIDEDGVYDILNVDEDGSGVADILEADMDGDGIADAMMYDGMWDESTKDGILDESEIWDFLWNLELQYTNGYMVDARALEPIKVTCEDGTIIVKDLDALEFIMERKFPDDTLMDQYYGNGETVKDYENDFRFRIPNFWVRPMVTIDNNFYQQGYDYGDSKWWGVLFGKDVKEFGDYREEQFASYPDDAVILYTESFGSMNIESEVEHGLRFLVNGDEKCFIITSYSYWEEIEGTQIPIYLYCSDAGDEVHEHIYTPWTSLNDELHRRECTVEGCTKFEMTCHNKDESKGYEPDLENPELGHWVSCTECEERYHESHTREKYNYRYPNMWWDAGDGINHVVYCTVCDGPAAYEEHRWGEWKYSGRYDSATQSTIWGHYRTCKEFPCPGEQWSVECVYDEGEITKAPTCSDSGIITYTCLASNCQFETKTYTEVIPALGHEWGEWEAVEGDDSKEYRVCKHDSTHIEEREVVTHDHVWNEWHDDGTNENHVRKCTVEGCSAKQTEQHNLNRGEITLKPNCTEEGIITYTCQTCNHKITESIASLGHNWNAWTPNEDEKTHSCKCDCGETMTEEHEFDDGSIIVYPTYTEQGVVVYRCVVCDYSYEEYIPQLIKEGFVEDEDGTRYYYDDGSYATGWVTIEDKTYRFDPETGLLFTESVLHGALDYYFNPDHSTIEGLVEEDGGLRFYKKGVRQYGWADINYDGENDTYFYVASQLRCEEDRVLFDGIDARRFFIYDGETGFMRLAEGFYVNNEGTQFFKKGIGQYGWITEDGISITDKPGITLSDVHYFAYGDGINFYMVKDAKKTIGGVVREFDENHLVKSYTGWATNKKTGNANYYIDGVMQQGWCETPEGWIYLSRSENLANNITYGDVFYGWRKIGGKVYYFRASTSTPQYTLITDAERQLTYNGVRDTYYVNQPANAELATGADYYITNPPAGF